MQLWSCDGYTTLFASAAYCRDLPTLHKKLSIRVVEPELGFILYIDYLTDTLEGVINCFAVSIFMISHKHLIQNQTMHLTFTNNHLALASTQIKLLVCMQFFFPC